MSKIYGAVLSSATGETLTEEITKLFQVLVATTYDIVRSAQGTFLPTSTQPQYQFSMCYMNHIFSSMLLLSKCESLTLRNAENVVRLWVHECKREFCDRLNTAEEEQAFDDILRACISFNVTSAPLGSDVFPDDLVPNSLSTAYSPIPLQFGGTDTGDGSQVVNNLLQTSPLCQEVASFNSVVLTQHFINHLVRIHRIMLAPGRHVILGGDESMGNSKQLLVKVSSYIAGYDFHQLPFYEYTSSLDWKESMKDLLNDVLIFNKRVVCMVDEYDNEIFLQVGFCLHSNSTCTNDIYAYIMLNVDY